VVPPDGVGFGVGLTGVLLAVGLGVGLLTGLFVFANANTDKLPTIRKVTVRRILII
jgi:hypothetical protein